MLAQQDTIDLHKARLEMREARREMLEARAEVLHAKAELRKKRHVLQWHNELRIGWGDQIFETLMWHNPTNIITTMPADWRRTYKEEYKHHQHLWLEYQYFVTHWFSAGGMMDLSEVGWTDVTRNGKGEILAKSDRKYFYNVVLMPTIRFTYISHPNAHLYSCLGAGVCFNSGTELNAYKVDTDAGFAVNTTLIGVSANYKRWFIAADFGGMMAMRNTDYIFMGLSRIFNLSIGVRL